MSMDLIFVSYMLMDISLWKLSPKLNRIYLIRNRYPLSSTSFPASSTFSIPEYDIPKTYPPGFAKVRDMMPLLITT